MRSRHSRLSVVVVSYWGDRIGGQREPVREPRHLAQRCLPSLRPELLRAATRDAPVRANVLVDATGAELGGVRSVDVGVFQVTAPDSTEVSDYGEYNTSTRLKDVTAVVNVTFALR